MRQTTAEVILNLFHPGVGLESTIPTQGIDMNNYFWKAIVAFLCLYCSVFDDVCLNMGYVHVFL